MLGTAVETIIVLFLGAMFVIVVFRLLSGDINTTGLLADKETGAFSPGRLQLLLATAGGAVFYFSSILTSPNVTSLPEFPTELLVIMGMSNAGYLGGKVYSRFFSAHARGTS